MNATEIARVCHEVNRAYCQAIGDDSQPSWEGAPSWQRDSAITGVHFHIDNPGATPQESHEKWLEQKQADGWKYGPAKDPSKKEHPCFVPYDQLPVEQRAKDYLFRAVVHQLKPQLDQPAGSYNALEMQLRSLPLTWIPALLRTLLTEAKAKNVFRPGGLREFTRPFET